MATKFEIDSLASSLKRMAESLRSDAEGLDRLAERIQTAAIEHPDAALTDFAPHVLERVFRALNNSSIIGTAEYAIGAVSKSV